MEQPHILEVSPLVRWIGVLDPDIVTFDVVMETKYGTTYNSYFIDAGKKCIVETTKGKFREEYLEKVKAVCDPSTIEYIVMNHSEPDHSGNLKYLLELAPEAVVVGSGNAIRYLQDIVGRPFRHRVVKDGETLDLGTATLRFIAAPNLHWPDSMYTYLVEDQVLFTCDSFGAHFCHPAMFNDLVGDFSDAYRYYFDVILRPFSKFMVKAVDKISSLPIRVIGTGHGPILREGWKDYVNQARTWAEEYLALDTHAQPRLYVAYVSAYGYTAEMARIIADSVRSGFGIEVVCQDIEHMSTAEIESEIIQCNAILLGCPTLNQNILLPIYRLFSVISPIRDKGKLAGAFGSYGWSGEGLKLMEENLKNLKLRVPIPGVAVKFLPQAESQDRLRVFSQEFCEELLREFQTAVPD